MLQGFVWRVGESVISLPCYYLWSFGSSLVLTAIQCILPNQASKFGQTQTGVISVWVTTAKLPIEFIGKQMWKKAKAV